MRFSPDLETLTLLRLEEHNWCLYFPAEDCRRDGDVIIYRDGLRVMLHRYLWEKIHGHPLGEEFFMLHNPGCKTPPDGLGRCANPLHRIVSRSSVLPAGRSPRPSRATGAPTAPELNAAKTHCPANHPYTEENTYIWVDKNGKTHRKCKRCTLRRTRKHHADERATRKASR